MGKLPGAEDGYPCMLMHKMWCFWLAQPSERILLNINVFSSVNHF